MRKNQGKSKTLRQLMHEQGYDRLPFVPFPPDSQMEEIVIETQDNARSPCRACGDGPHSPPRHPWGHTNPDCPRYKLWQAQNRKEEPDGPERTP